MAISVLMLATAGGLWCAYMVSLFAGFSGADRLFWVWALSCPPIALGGYLLTASLYPVRDPIHGGGMADAPWEPVLALAAGVVTFVTWLLLLIVDPVVRWLARKSRELVRGRRISASTPTR
ncbi:hypothetical protein [Luteipulveratus mongoliensis]|uniref:Uncharacterized protein n=1 Tax=Luteipulveratus mongoliensis TaxID=571913 RepID=A0A0K1JE78_9MICO|nr:hypothetical protein [Luteipulveratus mongoliensis]AKU15011.1 hypothetical protein VV02_02600 [Luteipulveratus mongoliensis]